MIEEINIRKSGHHLLREIVDIATENIDAIQGRKTMEEKEVITADMDVRIDVGLPLLLLNNLLHQKIKEGRSIKNIIIIKDDIHLPPKEVQV